MTWLPMADKPNPGSPEAVDSDEAWREHVKRRLKLLWMKRDIQEAAHDLDGAAATLAAINRLSGGEDR